MHPAILLLRFLTVPFTNLLRLSSQCLIIIPICLRDLLRADLAILAAEQQVAVCQIERKIVRPGMKHLVVIPEIFAELESAACNLSDLLYFRKAVLSAAILRAAFPKTVHLIAVLAVGVSVFDMQSQNIIYSFRISDINIVPAGPRRMGKLRSQNNTVCILKKHYAALPVPDIADVDLDLFHAGTVSVEDMA